LNMVPIFITIHEYIYKNIFKFIYQKLLFNDILLELRITKG
jgi:hypothetical protein